MTLDEYLNKLEKITLKDKYLKSDLLKDEFKLYYQGEMKIFYAPHNVYLNKKAKILIVGICPGWTQTEIAFKTARKLLVRTKNAEEISKICKREARFAGAMRTNLIKMLDELKLNEKLNLKSSSELFAPDNDLLHTTSLIPYPVFIKDKNYTGYSPKILDSPVLREYIEKHFYAEVKVLKDVFIIPLGNAVEGVLKDMVAKKILTEEQCLFAFPHPSGANGHRISQFNDNKEMLLERINSFFKNRKC